METLKDLAAVLPACCFVPSRPRKAAPVKNPCQCCGAEMIKGRQAPSGAPDCANLCVTFAEFAK